MTTRDEQLAEQKAHEEKLQKRREELYEHARLAILSNDPNKRMKGRYTRDVAVPTGQWIADEFRRITPPATPYDIAQIMAMLIEGHCVSLVALFTVPERLDAAYKLDFLERSTIAFRSALIEQLEARRPHDGR